MTGAGGAARRVGELLVSPGWGFVGGIAALIVSFTLDQIVLPSDRARAAEAFTARAEPLAQDYVERAEALRTSRETLADAMLLGANLEQTKAQFRHFQKAQRSHQRVRENMRTILKRSPMLDESQKALIETKFEHLRSLSDVMDRCVVKAMEAYGATASASMAATPTPEPGLRCPVYSRDSRYIFLDKQLDLNDECQASLARTVEAVVYNAAGESRVSVLGIAGRWLGGLFGDKRPAWADWSSVAADLEAGCPSGGRWASWYPNNEPLYPWQRNPVEDDLVGAEADAAAAAATDVDAAASQAMSGAQVGSSPGRPIQPSAAPSTTPPTTPAPTNATPPANPPPPRSSLFF